MANNISLSHSHLNSTTPTPSLPSIKRKSDQFLHHSITPLSVPTAAIAKRRHDETPTAETIPIHDDDDDDDEDNRISVREEEEESSYYFFKTSSLEKIIDRFETITKDPARVQREVLKKILEQNSKAEYLTNLGLNGRTDPESFNSCVPLSTYPDLKPYVDRIYSGEKSGVLTTKPITTISLSSGTSEGKPKRVPFTEEMIDAYVESMMTSYAYRNREYPVDESKMSLQFLYISDKSTTHHGLTIGLVSAHLITHPKFPNSYRVQPSSPQEVLTTPNKAQALYCHLLTGLKHRFKIQYIYAVFAHTLVTSLKHLEQTYQQISHDIRTGFPNPQIVTDSRLRSAVTASLGGPDPEGGDEVLRLCEDLKGRGWVGLVPCLFPDVKYLLGVMTGTAEHYLGRLRVYADDVPLKGVDYGSTEGWVGTNVRPEVAPEDICYVPIPDIAYFEFIPLDDDDDDQVLKKKDTIKPVGLTEVKVGQRYEVVFTNFQGMYRYRLGDWVKVTGYYNSTPELQYICRGNVMLSINIDKTTEKDLQAVVDTTVNKHLVTKRIELVDFTSQADLTSGNEHYIIYWELDTSNMMTSDGDMETVLRKCSLCLDESFEDLGYRTSRLSGGIGALELRVVKSGTFKMVVDQFSCGDGGSCGVQFKMSRCVKNEQVLRILKESVVGSYFSDYDQCLNCDR